MMQLDIDAFPVAASPAFDRASAEAAIERACARVAPLWPLTNFVAVNPFLGFAGTPFHETVAAMHRIARVSMLMPRSFYRDAFENGMIGPQDVAVARAAAPQTWPIPRSASELRQRLAGDSPRSKHPAHVPSVAEVLDSVHAGDAIASGTAFMVDEVSKWCAAYFDKGQSVWRLPGRGLRPYAAWRAAMKYDYNPEAMGIKNFRSIVASLPDDPVEAIHVVLEREGVPKRAATDYLHAALLNVSGWASYARYLGWQCELRGERDDSLVELLAIRVAWGFALFSQHGNDEFSRAWKLAMKDAEMPPLDTHLGGDAELCAELIAQEAYERSFQRQLFSRLRTQTNDTARAERPMVQAAFCIDVRSEVFRRALESLDAGVETLGFAGFFGFAMRYVRLGEREGGAQCPVLLSPAFEIHEGIEGASQAEEGRYMVLRQLRRRVSKAWKAFKSSAVSSFVFVETIGLSYFVKLLTDAFALTASVTDPDVEGLSPAIASRLGPHLLNELALEQRVAMAETALRGMSLKNRFAPLMLLVGHGSTTANNPYATALDCGACGGYTGEANARVAASVLNDAAVRAELHARGLQIPDDTRFVAALHDTTTDEVRLFDATGVPQEIHRLLERAGHIVRLERSASLRVAATEGCDDEIKRRARDWSQVRPEWGLARNAAFIAAPRAQTRGTDFGGRAFLHDYDFNLDSDQSVLELILTAPVVVACWINLQYFGSTVNNRVFGSGNKVLHNVVSGLGVLEGYSGDLRTGLPWHSVHDGTRFVHEPLRLNVVVEAPRQAIDAILSKHEHVRNLVENRWMHLYATGDGEVMQRSTHGWTQVAQ